MMNRVFRAAAAAVVAAGLWGCPPEPRVDTGMPVAGEEIAYAPLAERYNRRIGNLSQLWSRAVVEIRWVDKDGEKHFEQGDGPLIVRQPSDVALALGKMGNTILWTGANAERYWLFQLDPPDDQPKTASVGRIANLATRPPRNMPVPVAPQSLVHLLGMSRLPESGGEAYRSGDRALVVVPSEGGQNGSWHILVDPVTARPSRVMLVDDRGVVIDAMLSEYGPVKLKGVGLGSWPEIPMRVSAQLPREKASIDLSLENATDGNDEDEPRIRDYQFDFEKLRRSLNVDRVIDLDRQAGAPGVEGAGLAATPGR